MLRDDQKEYLRMNYAREKKLEDVLNWIDKSWLDMNGVDATGYKLATPSLLKGLFDCLMQDDVFFKGLFPPVTKPSGIAVDEFIPANKFMCDCGLNGLNYGKFEMIKELDGGWIKQIKCGICGLEYGIIEKNFYNFVVENFDLIADDLEGEFISRISKLGFSDEWKIFQKIPKDWDELTQEEKDERARQNDELIKRLLDK